MQNLQILPSIPSEFSPSVPTSSSDFVVSRRMREYIADGQTTYTYSGNNVIKFTLNSADAFLDGRNSWIQFKLFGAFSADGNLANVDAEKLSRFLETGGAHSLFRRLRISLSNGTIISDYDYSQIYAIVRQHTMSASHLQFQEGPGSFDGLSSDIYDYDVNSGGKIFDYSVVTAANALGATYDFGTRTLTFAGAHATGVKVGDEIAIITPVDAPNNSSGMIIGKVISNTGTVIVLSTDALQCGQDIDLNAGDINAVAVVRRGDASHRYRGSQGTTDANHVLCKMKLFSDFFNNVKYLPLPFLRNLTIELTLNRDAHCVVFAKNSDPGAVDFRWTVKDPVVVANLVTPSEALMNAYVDQYNSEQGIMLHWIDYMSNKRTLELAQSQSIVIPSNCHSALGVIAVQKLAEAEAQTGNSWVTDTHGINVKALLQEYQFQVGSEYFPFSKPVQCGTGAQALTNGNAYQYVLQTLDSHGAKYECSSIVPNEFYAVNSVVRPVNVGGGAAGLTNESLRFVLAARLDRDGNYTGIDTSNNDIQLNLVRTGVPGAPYTGYYLHSWIVHNRLMRISKASSIVFS
jgi:hypothetical protein